MKKLSIILACFALIGAGCTSASTSQPSKSSATNGTINLNQPGTQTVQTSDGSTAQVKIEPITPQTKGSTGTNDEDVPVVDVFLGTPEIVIQMDASNFAFKPNTFKVKAGKPAQVAFKNVEGTHTFVIDGVTQTQMKSNTSVTFNAPSKPGTYPFYCSIDGHKEKGMTGTMIVE